MGDFPDDEFEEHIIRLALHVATHGDQDTRPERMRSVLITYLRQMHLCLEQWGDLKVWRHLRLVEDPEAVRIQFEQMLAGNAPVDPVWERQVFDDWRLGNNQANGHVSIRYLLCAERRACGPKCTISQVLSLLALLSLLLKENYSQKNRRF